MSAEHPVLGRLEALLGSLRNQVAHLAPEVAHLRAEREIIVKYLSELATSLPALISARQASDDKAAAEGKRADTAEAENAALKAQIAADESTLKGMLDKVDAEVALETAPATAPTVTTTPSDATVTVDLSAGTTTHVDPVGTTTTVDHATGTATAVDATATTVEPAPAAVAEAQAATVAAGVTVPSAS